MDDTFDEDEDSMEGMSPQEFGPPQSHCHQTLKKWLEINDGQQEMCVADKGNDEASINVNMPSNTCLVLDDDASQSLDEDLPRYLREQGDFRFPTYAERRERGRLAHGALKDAIIMPPTKRRRIFFHKVYQRE